MNSEQLFAKSTQLQATSSTESIARSARLFCVANFYHVVSRHR